MKSRPIDAVKSVASRARESYLEALRRGDDLFAEHGITTAIRMAHFLAQALHETRGFEIERESMSYRAERIVEVFGVNRHSAAVTEDEARELERRPEALAERVYGLGNRQKALELGNAEPGDGFRYRGNGVLQTTGRLNHRLASLAVGVDFEAAPELVTEPDHALKPALVEWTRGNLNALADKNDIRGITRRINGGFNGLADRESWFARVWEELRGEDQPEEPWRTGEGDGDVSWLQAALNTLGADPLLVVDGRYGPETVTAVRAFQEAAELAVDGIAGPVTRAAIKVRLDTLR